MTRDEHRTTCIHAVATAMCGAGWEELPERDIVLAHAVKIFDSLNRVAHVNPIEATEEMMRSYTGAVMTVQRECWNAMSASGDLTNPPEPKP